MFIKILSKLLNASNSNPTHSSWFYQIKDTVLKKYGSHIGWDLQHILKKCWSCRDGIFSGYHNGCKWVSMPEETCFKCRGTGTFDEFWVYLEVWNLGAYEFHCPIDRVRKMETPVYPIRHHIEGYIKHKPHDRRKVAFWILACIFSPNDVLAYKRNRINGIIKYQLCAIKAVTTRLFYPKKKEDFDLPF